MKRDLERVDVPDEHEARGRAWEVVSAAFAEHEPVAPERHRLRVAIAIAIVAGLVAATVSAPGRAVLDEIREAVGVERAQQGLFSLPASGRLLVASDEGAWAVQQDGSKRLLGDYSEASWSPFGRFVVAARRNELAALEPDGDVRWTLARPRVHAPRWSGTETDTRIAYHSRNAPRVVAGDGAGDGPICDVSAQAVPPAWRPGGGYVLALVAPGGTPYVVDLDDCVVRWTAARIARAQRLEWSSDGERLLVVGATRLVVLNGDTGRVAATTPGMAGAFRPGGRTLGRIVRHGGRSRVLVGRRGVVFSASGRLEHPVWSPDGRWLLLSWPSADQFVFVRSDGKRLRAVANVSEQFRSRSFPRIEGWCCSASGD